MSRFFVNWRAALSANSFASEPPVEKNTLFSDLGASSTSFFASRIAATVPCLPETCRTSPICRAAASAMRGWQWPALFTK